MVEMYGGQDYEDNLENRIDYLEYVILILLMNNGLHELMQELLLDEINKCAKWDDGETILRTLKDSVNWESLVGNTYTDQETLDDFTQKLYNKLTSYRRHGNLNG